MPGILGRFDHFGFDGTNQLIVAALGNNSVEIIDISARIRSHSITGIPNPQGVVYAPQSKKLFAASSKGRLYIYDGATLGLIKTIDFHGDVDNLRYDAADQRVYVGYGEKRGRSAPSMPQPTKDCRKNTNWARIRSLFNWKPLAPTST